MNKGHWLAAILIVGFLTAVAAAIYVVFVPARGNAPSGESGPGIRLETSAM